MKRYLIYLTIVMMAMVSLSLTACGDDNDENTTENSSTDYTKVAEGQISVYSMSDVLRYTIDVKNAGWCSVYTQNVQSTTNFAFDTMFSTTSTTGQVNRMYFLIGDLTKESVGKDVSAYLTVKISRIDSDGYLVDDTYVCDGTVSLVEFGNPYITFEFKDCAFSKNATKSFKLSGKIKYPIRKPNGSTGMPTL